MSSPPTIAGLHVAAPIEQALRNAFNGWAPHFRSRLQNEGLSFLLARYESVVESIETRSCCHGRGGTLKTGDAWQWCCGISYEYSNDIAVRDALEIILTAIPTDSETGLRSNISALDARLCALYEHRPPRSGKWWHQGLPRGVLA